MFPPQKWLIRRGRKSAYRRKRRKEGKKMGVEDKGIEKAASTTSSRWDEWTKGRPRNLAS